MATDKTTDKVIEWLPVPLTVVGGFDRLPHGAD